MNKFHLTILLFLIFSISYLAQNWAKKENYYKTIANTKSIVKNESSMHTNKVSIPRGSTIFVYSTDDTSVYFRMNTLNNSNKLNKNDLYSMSILEFTENYFRPYITFSGGLLNTPFKYRPDKKKIFPGGNLAYYGAFTISPYFGLEFKPLLFGGLTTISLENSTNDEKVSKLGYTFGMGVGIHVFEAFNIGLISGWDLVDESFDSNGKVWFAFSFNFDL